MRRGCNDESRMQDGVDERATFSCGRNWPWQRLLPALRRYLRCRASGLRTLPLPTACPTITFLPCWWMETACGPGLRMAWRFTRTQVEGLHHRGRPGASSRDLAGAGQRTGDVWAGTMGGLSRISGGRIDSFTQLNSGLSNNVVYGVAVEGENVWVATAAGACRLDLHTGEWSLYNERNTPMVEIWVYGVSATPSKVYYARVGQRRPRIRPEDRALGQVRRPGRRNRNGPLQRSGLDPRNCHVGQLRGQHPLGSHVLR